MAMNFKKQDLKDYINKLSTTRRDELKQEFEKFVEEKFSEVFDLIDLSLSNGEKIQKLAKQLSQEISKFEEADPTLRYSYNMPSSYRYVSANISYMATFDAVKEVKKAILNEIVKEIREDRMLNVLSIARRYTGDKINKERLSILFSECYTEYLGVEREVNAVHQISREATTVVIKETTAKKAYNILKGMNYPLEAFEKKMLIKKPELPAVYKFTEPVCKLIATCQE